MRNASLLALLAAAALAGCSATATRYPLTGAECGPDDPVRDLGASDCAAPVQG